jgi:hypothetical protein
MPWVFISVFCVRPALSGRRRALRDRRLFGGPAVENFSPGHRSNGPSPGHHPSRRHGKASAIGRQSVDKLRMAAHRRYLPPARRLKSLHVQLIQQSNNGKIIARLFVKSTAP